MSEQHTQTQQYSEPVSQLLTIDEAATRKYPWPDYQAMGINASHAPELIRMATNHARYEDDCPDTEVWPPIHAWRALGQIGAIEAIEPLLELMDEGAWKDDDWVLEELPEVFALIGPLALRPLEDFLDNRKRCMWAQLSAAQGIEKIGNNRPNLRDACVAIIARQLQTARYNSKAFNGLIIGYLLDLKAVEAAELIERAFADGCVDEFCAGDWPDVRYELGLGPKPQIGGKSIRKHLTMMEADDATPTTNQSRKRKRSKRNRK